MSSTALSIYRPTALPRLVNSLLDMTRIQSGTLEVQRRPGSLPDIVDEALAELHSSLVGRLIDVVIPDGLPCVDVDPLLIAQVLANLVDNANRHGPPGTVITVSATMPGLDRREGFLCAITGRGYRWPSARRYSRSLCGSTPVDVPVWV